MGRLKVLSEKFHALDQQAHEVAFDRYQKQIEEAIRDVFLIEHNRTSKATKCSQYSDYACAQTASLQKEQQYFFEKRHEMEVVVFEANSIDDLKRTHSRYFVAEEKDNTGAVLAAVGLVGLAVYLLSKK